VFDVDVDAAGEGTGAGVRHVRDRQLPDNCRVTDADKDRFLRMVAAVDVVGTTAGSRI
jgi:hypothetical protein